jgi:hypothetical protein
MPAFCKLKLFAGNTAGVFSRAFFVPANSASKKELTGKYEKSFLSSKFATSKKSCKNKKTIKC